MIRVIPSLTEMISEVLAAENPDDALLRHMATLEEADENELICSLFESLFWRRPFRNYWIFYRAAYSYRLLGRFESSFLLSAICHRMNPSELGAFSVCQDMFTFFKAREQYQAAIDVFLDHARLFPERPVAPLWQVLPLFAATGSPLAALVGDTHGTIDESLRTDIPVIAESIWEPWTCDLYGGLPAFALNELAKRFVRPGVNVACLRDAVVLVKNDIIAVYDTTGRIHNDLSVHEFPILLKRHFDDLQKKGEAVETITIDEAVITTDRFPAPANLCHFLLDHITRLALYVQAGVDVTKVTVIDAKPKASFQQWILTACGVKSYIDTERICRIQVAKLWVSSNCKNLQHPAHKGAKWAIEYLRNTIGYGNPAGDRRLYISRGDAATRRITNEAQVVGLLARYGFSSLRFGEMSYGEQVKAFAGATHVVGPHGAGLTNIVFCQPGSHILEIFHPLYGTAAYAALAREGQLRYAAIVGRDGHSSDPEFNDLERVDLSRNAWFKRDIQVDLSELQKWLDKTAKFK